jgi:murein DD-endopeptidase MepM/ murein hydrolase activator NlpD
MSGNLQASKPRQPQNHKVRKGETAARIARDNGLSLAELSSFNPKLNLTKLSVGMTLKVGAEKQATRASVPALRLKGGPVHPVTPLPVTPALGPASLVHLERVLPMDPRANPPQHGESADRSAMPAAATPALASLRAVLPEGTSDELLPAPLAAPVGFEAADPNALDLLWPVETRTVSSAWGPRMRSKTVKVKARKRRIRYRGSHRGVDLTAPKGADVFAAMDGQVVASGRHRQYGNFVVLDHGNGVVTLYAHHNRNFVKEGDLVRRGQKIAEVGRTGNATGPHLHFELRVKGLPVNPLPVLNDVEEIPAELVAQNQAAVAPSASR